MQEKPLIEPGTSDNTAATEATSSTGTGFLPEYPDKSFNRRIALVSALGAVGLFLSGRLDFGGGGSLKELSAAALPYEEVFVPPMLSLASPKRMGSYNFSLFRSNSNLV